MGTYMDTDMDTSGFSMILVTMFNDFDRIHTAWPSKESAGHFVNVCPSALSSAPNCPIAAAH